MLRSVALVLLMLAASSAARAQPPSALAPPTATVNGFTATLVTTTDPARLAADWSKPGPGTNLHVEHQTVRGKPISAFIIFKGCRPDATGACDVVAHLRLVPPNGGAPGPDALIIVWPHRPPLPAPQYVLSLQAMTVAFDATDALGTYRLQSDITDRVAGVTVHLEGPVVLSGG